MRLVTPVVALIAALVPAACGSVTTAPKPDTAGDTAFVAALKQLCSKTPPLDPIDVSAGAAAITNAANTDNTTVFNFLYGAIVRGPQGKMERRGGIASLTPTISSTSPFAVAITDAGEMLLDMGKWYTQMVQPESINDPKEITEMAEIAAAREDQARSDLAKIGVTGCLS